MTRVSDERLAAMIKSHVNYVKGAGEGSPYAEILSALRELQQLRAAVGEHNAGACEECYEIQWLGNVSTLTG